MLAQSVTSAKLRTEDKENSLYLVLAQEIHYLKCNDTDISRMVLDTDYIISLQSHHF